MSSPGSPSGANYNDNFSHAQISPANSAGDIIDIASFPQKISHVTFFSETLPDPADAMDIDVRVDGVSILNGGTPFSISDTDITTDEIDVPLNDTLTDIDVGDLILCDRANTVGTGMDINLINVYKNDGSGRQNRAAPSGASQLQEFLSHISLTNGQNISQPIQKYGLFQQASFRVQAILSAAMAAGETITLNILMDGASLVDGAAFVIDDTTAALTILEVPISTAAVRVIAPGVPILFDLVYGAGVGGSRAVSIRLIGD